MTFDDLWRLKLISTESISENSEPSEELGRIDDRICSDPALEIFDEDEISRFLAWLEESF